MIRLTIHDDKVICIAEIGDRVGVYLDNDSLTDLAMVDVALRKRFLDALHFRGTLLFSWVNAIEVSSSPKVEEFLDAVGPHWIPLVLNPWEASEREKAGFGERAPVSETFLEAYFKARAYELSPNGKRILDLSSDSFFRLGAVVKWSAQNREAMRSWAPSFDDLLREMVAAYAANKLSLDQFFPPIVLDDRYPVTFVLCHLFRALVQERKAFHLKSGDGRDFCHAVLATACAQVAALDKQWRRRVTRVSPSHQLAQVYYRNELDQLVTQFEKLVLECR